MVIYIYGEWSTRDEVDRSADDIESQETNG